MSRKIVRGDGARVGNRRVRLGMVVGGLAVVAACVAVRYYWGADSASAGSNPSTSRPATAPSARSATTGRAATTPAAPAAERSTEATIPQIVAVVNGVQIRRDELAQECLRHYGEAVLERVVNKVLIAQECKRRNIVVTQGEVDDEVARLAQRFGLPTDQWLKMLKTERGINPVQYASDIIWPTLALRRLAGARLEATEAEVIEAFETTYGPSVRARLIACKDPEKAKSVRAAAVANPDAFGDLAMDHSDDASASLKGLIQPIRMHGGYEQIEKAAFTMADGEVSQVIPVAGQFIIIKREGMLPAQKVSYEQVKPQLVELVRDSKLRTVAQDVFRELQEASNVVPVWTDPKRRAEIPGVATIINGQEITINQLATMCLERHAQEVLEGTISRRLIEQACAKKGVKITQAEIENEVRQAAEASLPPRPDGSPDVENFLKLVCEQQEISADVYRRDSAWPAVALKKLVGEKLWASQEELERDLQKGYEANYGPRVRCLAIVLDNLRRAQDVWSKARQNLTPEFFGDLAAEYSIEPGSRALRGEVPPIQRHGGEPLLEKEAFSLQPGELSGVVQVGERYVILFCEGYTEPVGVSFAEVRDEIYRHVFEKRQQIAMADCFQQLQETATIDNYLAGTSQSPLRDAESTATARVPTLREVSPR